MGAWAYAAYMAQVNIDSSLSLVARTGSKSQSILACCRMPTRCWAYCRLSRKVSDFHTVISPVKSAQQTRSVRDSHTTSLDFSRITRNPKLKTPGSSPHAEMSRPI
jgi:hypothetical protein